IRLDPKPAGFLPPTHKARQPRLPRLSPLPAGNQPGAGRLLQFAGAPRIATTGGRHDAASRRPLRRALLRQRGTAATVAAGNVTPKTKTGVLLRLSVGLQAKVEANSRGKSS